MAEARFPRRSRPTPAGLPLLPPVLPCASEVVLRYRAAMAASSAARRCSGGSAAVAADTIAIVSRTARTSSAKAAARAPGAVASCRSIGDAFARREGVQRVGRGQLEEVESGRLGHDTPRQPRSPRNASRIRDLIVDKLADNRWETSAYVSPP